MRCWGAGGVGGARTDAVSDHCQHEGEMSFIKQSFSETVHVFLTPMYRIGNGVRVCMDTPQEPSLVWTQDLGLIQTRHRTWESRHIVSKLRAQSQEHD